MCTLAGKVLIGFLTVVVSLNTHVNIALAYESEPLSEAASNETLQISESTQVMILGSIHFDNPRRDVHNWEVDDVRTQQRQEELGRIIDALVAYNPTHICLEIPATDQYDEQFSDINSRKNSAYVERYLEYVAGVRELAQSEVDQIGFRLAKRLGHDRVYGVDALYRYNEPAVGRFAEEYGQESRMELSEKLSMEAGMELMEKLESQPLDDLFLYINTPEFHNRQQQTYLPLAGVGESNEYAGADLLGDWYVRNIRIFSNIMRLTESTEDRVLLIIGTGHGYHLRTMTKDSPQHTLVEFSNYLQSD